MPRVAWPLNQGKPRVEILLTQVLDGRQTIRNLLADTGTGSDQSLSQLILDENDCLTCGGKPAGTVRMSGAYSGLFPVYTVRVIIPQLNFDDDVRVVGVPSTPPDFDGIAGFRFLNRFGYGNFGDKGQFGLEA